MANYDFKPYISGSFRSMTHFKENVLDVVFCKENCDFSDNEFEDLTQDPQYSQVAESANIDRFLKVGVISTSDHDIYVYEAILKDESYIARSRVGIQNLVRKALEYYTNAFVVFHYRNPEGRSWRFSYLYKEDKLKNITSAKRYTYLFGDGYSGRTANERFNTLIDRYSSNGSISDMDLQDAFAIEPLSNEFFKSYTDLYKEFCKFAIDKSDDPQYFGFKNFEQKYIRDYVKKMLGRLLFLQYVQKKGWMKNANGERDYNFVQNLFNNCSQEDREDFLDKVLEPLFFAMLNTAKEGRKKAFESHNEDKKSAVKWDKKWLDAWEDNIPYLNGGLFEQDNYDKPRSRFDVSLFEKLFELFSNFNFTIDENDPDDAEIGVDPEMLGRIFENELEDNKDKGAFYTPKEIVQYMCKESLIAYLHTDATDEEHKKRLRNFVNTHDASKLENIPFVLNKIKNVKICDPAIGSGAFPMGLLNELVACTLALNPKESKFEVKKHIIQNSIYGVDIEKGAVEIARLRFWLSLVVDQETPCPLPNLDYKIMQGNSLLEEYEGIDLSQLKQNKVSRSNTAPQRNLFGEIVDRQLTMTFQTDEQVETLSELIKSYYDVHGADKALSKKKIGNEITSILEFNFKLKLEALTTEINLTKAKQSDMESQLPIKEEIRDNNKKALAKLNKSLDGKEITPYYKTKIKQLEKALDKSASDVLKLKAEISKCKSVILSCENEQKRLTVVLQELNKKDLTETTEFFLWHTWFSEVFENGGFDIVIGNPPYIFAREKISAQDKLLFDRKFRSAKYQFNTYIVFMEQFINLSKEDAVNTLIVPNSWLMTYSGEALRDLLLNNVSLLKIVNILGQSFENAGVETIIAIWKNQLYNNETQLEVLKAEDGIISSLHFSDQEKFRKNDGHSFNVFSDSESDSIISKMRMDSRPLDEVACVKAGLKAYEKGKGKPPQSETDVNKRIYDYNYQFDEETHKYLDGSNVLRYGFNWSGVWLKYGSNLAAPRDFSLFSNPKIVVREITGKFPKCLNATYIEDLYLFNMSNIAVVNRGKIDTNLLKYILGIINSTLISYYFKKNTAKAERKLFPKIILKDLRLFPIKNAKKSKQSPIIALVDQILSAKEKNPSADTTALEAEIDRLVYELYGLTEDEIRIVEGQGK